MTHSSPVNTELPALEKVIAALKIGHKILGPDEVDLAAAAWLERLSIRAQCAPDRDAIAAVINDRTMINDEGFVQNSETVADAILALTPPVKSTPTPSDAREMLDIADAYEAGLQKMIACGYEEYGPEPQHKHRLIIEALRLAGNSSFTSPERPKCKLCGLEDGACICAHIPARSERHTADSVSEYLADYEFRFEGGGGHIPTDSERAMLEDAIEGYMSCLEGMGVPAKAAEGSRPDLPEGGKPSPTPQYVPDREQIAKIIEHNCHRIAMVKLYEPRMIECRKLTDAVLAFMSPERGQP